MLNALDRKSLLYLIIVALVAAFVGVGFFYYFSIIEKKPPSISDCENMECVKGFALSENFNPQDCQNALQGFRNDCYYTYEVENTLATKRNPGKYCGPITDENLRADCFYKTRSVVTMTEDTLDTMYEAMKTSSSDICDKITIPELKEECIKAITLMQKARDEKNLDTCFDESVDIDYSIKILCYQILDEELELEKFGEE